MARAGLIATIGALLGLGLGAPGALMVTARLAIAQPAPAQPAPAKRTAPAATGFAQARQAILATQGRFKLLLAAYATDKDCLGPRYAAAESVLYNLFDQFDSYPKTVEAQPDYVLQANDMVDFADTAARKHCTEVALHNYDAALQIFTGPLYAPMRARAQAGITALSRK